VRGKGGRGKREGEGEERSNERRGLRRVHREGRGKMVGGEWVVGGKK